VSASTRSEKRKPSTSTRSGEVADPRAAADLLVGDLKTHVAFLEKLPAPLPQTRHESFHH
jgi:hypothetical protein